MRKKVFVCLFLLRDCVSVRGDANAALFEFILRACLFVFQREEKCEQWRIKWCTISFCFVYFLTRNTCLCNVGLFVYISFRFASVIRFDQPLNNIELTTLPKRHYNYKVQRIKFWQQNNKIVDKI